MSAARQWLMGRPDAASVLFGLPCVEARSSGEARGLGLFATRDIPAFIRILGDAPLILLKPTDDLPQLYEQFQNLPEEAKELYLSLSYDKHNHNRDVMLKDKLLKRGFSEGLTEMVNVASIMQTNAFNVDLNDGKGSSHRALFARIARINHSCAPNAHVCFYRPSSPGSKGSMVVHTLAPLQAGEEIVISYFNILLPRDERQTKAFKWGFSCRCSVCDESSQYHASAEAARKDITEFNAQRSRIMQSARTPVRTLTTVCERGQAIVALTLETSALYPALPELYDGLGMLQAKILIEQKRELERDQVIDHLKNAALWDARITGPESPATIGRLQKLVKFASRRGEVLDFRIAINATGDYAMVRSMTGGLNAVSSSRT